MKTMLYAPLLWTLLISGCADQAVITRVVTQRVEVPVPVKPTPPPELVVCPGEWPKITFYKPSDPRYVAALDKAGAEALQQFGSRTVACVRAHRAWAQ